jgi:ferredoxin
VTIDPDLCIGSGECVRLVPDGFAIDEASGVSVPQPGVADAHVERLEEAERSCPTGALRLLRTAVPDADRAP